LNIILVSVEVGVEAEVADAFELVVVAGGGGGEGGLEFGVVRTSRELGLRSVEDVLTFFNIRGVGLGEEFVVDANLGVR